MKTNLTKNFADYNFQRIIIIGCPCTGKSTLSDHLNKITDLPVVYLDKLYWKPNWVPSEKEEFDNLLNIELLKNQWIMDGNYSRTLPLRIEKCDLIIYLDYESDFCLQSYYQRVKYGRVKGHITEGCVEQIDDEFIEYIKNFNKINRNRLYELIEKSNKSFFIFNSRKELKEYFPF